MTWFSSGSVVNPATDAILIDSGQLDGGQSRITVILGANVAAGTIVAIEHRNAANNANINSQVIACTVNQAVQYELPGVIFAVNERLRLRLVLGVTGTVSASLFLSDSVFIP